MKRGGGAKNPEWRGQVDVEHGPPLCVGHLLDDVVPGITGIVDDDVEAAEAIDRARDEALADFGRNHIAHIQHRFAASLPDRLHDLRSRPAVTVVDHQLRAFARQLPGDCGADATPGTGDQRDFSGHPEHVVAGNRMDSSFLRTLPSVLRGKSTRVRITFEIR